MRETCFATSLVSLLSVIPLPKREYSLYPVKSPLPIATRSPPGQQRSQVRKGRIWRTRKAMRMEPETDHVKLRGREQSFGEPEVWEWTGDFGGRA